MEGQDQKICSIALRGLCELRGEYYFGTDLLSLG